MIPVQHIDPDDLALYAMHLLPADEAEEMASNLEYSPQARRMLAEIYSDLSVLALSADTQAPLASAHDRLMKQVAREKKVLPMPAQQSVAADVVAIRSASPFVAEEPAPPSFAARTAPWLGWAIAAMLLLEAGNLYQQRQRLEHTVDSSRAQVRAAESRTASAVATAAVASSVLSTIQDPAAIQVALTTSGLKPPPQGRATYVPGKGSLVFLASNLDPLRPNKTYELWLIPADGKAPIPAGTFVPDKEGFASVMMPSLPPGIKAKAFGVTIENAGGSPVPTTAIMLHGAAS